MHTGTVIQLGDRSSGLIKEAGVEEPLFFHADALVDFSFKNLHEGDKLSFKIIESRKGPYATEIRKV